MSKLKGKIKFIAVTYSYLSLIYVGKAWRAGLKLGGPFGAPPLRIGSNVKMKQG
jgi:hypothetical protein